MLQKSAQRSSSRGLPSSPAPSHRAVLDPAPALLRPAPRSLPPPRARPADFRYAYTRA
jgi:hypothetical protein